MRCALLALALLLHTATWAASEAVWFEPEPGVRLAGTLELADQAKAPQPVVVLAVGAGPWGRGGYVAIRARLHADGIATLSYDKRGFGESSGTFDESLPVVSRDVAAAVAYLRSRRDVDAKRIALVGHSQGGGALPLAASQMGGIVGVVMLAAPIGPRGEVFGGLMRSTLRKNGMPADAADRVVAATLKWLEQRARGAAGAERDALREGVIGAFVAAGLDRPKSEGFVQTLDTPMVLSMYDVALDEQLRRSKAPVLAVYAGADDIVLPDYSVPAASTALRNHPDALVLLVPGVNHGLDRLDPMPAAKPGALPEDGMAPVVVDTVSQWLAKRLK